MSRRSHFYLFAAAAALLTPAAHAQSNPEEIVVTATRREQALQDVSAAVTPITSDLVRNSGIRDLQDITAVTPSLQFNVSENETSATARIRGIGTQGSNPGLESAVGVFIDGVYRARNGVALTDLGEVSQIEVLRGPQGTLFGRNTSAGLISIRTAAPDLAEFSANAEASYGSYGDTRVAAGFSAPIITDELAVRLFATRAVRDGFMDVVNAAGVVSDANTRDVTSVRGQALWAPTGNFSLRLIGDYSERDETCCAGALYNAALVNGAPGAFPAPSSLAVAALGGFGPGGIGAIGNGDFGLRRAFGDRENIQQLQDSGFSAEANWVIGDLLLTSVTGYRSWDFDQGQDADFTALDVRRRAFDGATGFGFDTFSQELRLAGVSGPIDWLIGAYVSDEELTRGEGASVGTQFGDYVQALNAAFRCLNGAVGAPCAVTANVEGSRQRDTFTQEGQQIALFTHNIWSLSPRTQLTLGLRATHEEKDLNANIRTELAAGVPAGGGPAILAANVATLFAGLSPADQAAIAAAPCGLIATPTVRNAAVGAVRSLYCLNEINPSRDGAHNQSREEDEWSGIAALRHEFTDATSAYVSYARGYKGGGFNLDRDFSPGAFNTSFPAETVDSWELGLRTRWLDDSLIANFTLFANAFENFQLNTYNGIQFVVASVPEVESQGIELDLIWRAPVEGLSFQGGAAYVDAQYGDDTGWVAATANPLTGVPLFGNLPNAQVTNAPRWTITGATTLERPVFDDSMLGLVYVDFRHVTDQNTGSDLAAAKIQEAYWLVNARAGLMTLDERWSFELWARNLLDEDYAQIMFDVPLQTGARGAFLGDPQSFGVTLRVQR